MNLLPHRTAKKTKERRISGESNHGSGHLPDEDTQAILAALSKLHQSGSRRRLRQLSNLSTGPKQVRTLVDESETLAEGSSRFSRSSSHRWSLTSKSRDDTETFSGMLGRLST